MTALTTNLSSTYESKYGTIQAYKVGASTHIWRYATVVLHDDGYAYQATEDVTDTLKQIVIGIAQEEIDNSLGIAGAKVVRVRREGRAKRFFAGSLAQTALGKLACIKDDQTVQLYTSGSTGKIVMGRIAELINSQEVYVDIVDRPVRLATSANL
jgi:hypothetical protein